jgi:tetratricopeptide (TPR) repeat protein
LSTSHENRWRFASAPRFLARVALLFSFAALWASAQTSSSDWQQQLHDYIKNQQLDAALELVQHRLAEYPTDLEARGWRGRVLAWKGNWEGAEAEYRQVLEQAPNDTDILTALSDVLVWQQKLQEALQTLDRAHELDPRETEILVRRARVLQMLGRNSESQADFRSTLALDPADTVARSGLIGLAGETKHEFRVGEDVDTFNYTDPAQTQSLALLSRWTSRWSTVLGTNFYQRFGQDATKFGSTWVALLLTIMVSSPATRPSSNTAMASIFATNGFAAWKGLTSNAGFGIVAPTFSPST